MRKKTPTIVVIIICAIFVVGPFVWMFFNPLPVEYYIFQDIEECENLIPTEQTDANVKRYDTPSRDKHLKSLPYDEFFGIKFKSNKLEYEIFAYEFQDMDSALNYYINVTGQKSYEKNLPLNEQEENKLFLASRGLTQYEVIVLFNNKAYKLTAPAKYDDEISDLLKNTFSQKVFERK